MIENERQYRVTKKRIAQFEASLVTEEAQQDGQIHLVLRRIM